VSNPEFASTMMLAVLINSKYPKGKRPILVDDSGVYFKGKKVVVERNELCPSCLDNGINIKFKKCHHGKAVL